MGPPCISAPSANNISQINKECHPFKNHNEYLIELEIVFEGLPNTQRGHPREMHTHAFLLANDTKMSSVSFSHDLTDTVKNACVCTVSVYPHSNKEPSYLPHFPWMFLFAHPTAFSFLYSSGIAGRKSTFLFLGWVLCVLANNKIFDNGKRLRLSQCC